MLSAIIVTILDDEKVAFKSVVAARTYHVFQRVDFSRRGVHVVFILKAKVKKS